METSSFPHMATAAAAPSLGAHTERMISALQIDSHAPHRALSELTQLDYLLDKFLTFKYKEPDTLPLKMTLRD